MRKISPLEISIRFYRFLRAGGVIGFPTDTAYGLGADPFSEPAVRRIFEIKGRFRNQTHPGLVDSMEMLQHIVDWPRASEFSNPLAQRFWPGPLTMILPALATCTTPRYGRNGNHRCPLAACSFCDVVDSCLR
jgi:L-threonylcarbamoyladenylate synthase